MTTTHEPTSNPSGQSDAHDPFADSSQTSEGGQELTSRHVTDAVERMIEVGAVLRLSEAQAGAVGVRRPGRRRSRPPTTGSTRCPTTRP